MDSPKPLESKQERKSKAFLCLAVIVGLLLLAILLLLILSFTVFKPKDPIISINWVSVEGVSVSIAPMNSYLNLTLLMDTSVTNPNKVGFKYGDSSAWLYYRGQVVGEVPIAAGDVSSGGTVEMIMPLTLMAEQLLSNPYLYSDVISGTLPLSTYTRIDGKVYILNMFKHHLVVYSSCIVVVNLRNATVIDSECRYKNGL
ncbi:uncharacterized protein LOC122071371 [Macadamia integrifolia]|uniref:uncharacterized protein LOC122071371 n=1 Tax=Macadamia integrifolia TaxID=60698 RepID=UPI001C4F5472|nr:uncharacterized protein LOC122071371 [Macadamia integrifolia]